MSDIAAPPEVAAPATPAPDAPPAAQDMSPLWSDPGNSVLSQDFANHLGEDVIPYANVLNDKYGGQPLSVLARSYGEANKMISEGGRPIGYPAPDADEATWEKWNTANAVPEKPEDYQLFGEGEAPENLNGEAMERFQSLLHGLKAPASLARELAKGYTQIEQEFAQKAADEYENQLHAANQQLQRDWGPEYEERMGSIKAMAVANGVGVDNPAIFDSPDTLRLLGKVVGLLGEDTIASWKQAAGGGQFGGGGVGEAHRIMSDPSHPDHKAYVESTDPNSPVNQKVNRLLQGG